MDRTISLTVEDDEFGEDFDVRVSLDDIRAALEKHAPGWSLHRLDDYERVTYTHGVRAVGSFPIRDGTYVLVPVESGETE